MTTRHQLRTFDRTVMVPALDALAADGWEVLACWPEGAGCQCLLRKFDVSDDYLTRSWLWLRTNTPFPPNRLEAALGQLPGEQEET